MVCVFCAFNITGDIKSLVQISIQKNQRNLNEILHISGNIENTKKADHILEMAGQGKFCDSYLEKFTFKLGGQINAAKYINNQDDIQLILHTVML